MAHSTEHDTPAQHLDQLIAEAADATGILPTIDRCHELHAQLLAAVTDLSEQVRRRLDGPVTDTTEWARCEQALLKAQGALTGSLGVGLVSAALHVETLGEAAAALAGCIESGRGR